MAVKTDWLPGKRTDQLAMAKNWSAILTAKGTQWQITRAMAAERNAVTTARCNEAFGGLTKLMRKIKSRKFFVPPLDDADLVSLGLKPKDLVKTCRAALGPGRSRHLLPGAASSHAPHKAAGRDDH
jgi:hypothetical protein